MSTVWKQAIKDFLNDGDEKNLRAKLRTEWIDIYPEEKAEVYNFLYHGRQHKLFVYLFAVDLQSQILEIPWNKALSILAKHRVNVTDPFLNEIQENLKKQKLISKIMTSLTEIIMQLKSKDRQHFTQKVLRTKQELQASARIAQSEQLVDQYVYYMNELKKMAPSEYNVASLITDREKQRADKIISKTLKKRARSIEEIPTISIEENEVIDKIETQAKKFLAQLNVQPSDFAFLFRSFGSHKKAIDFVYLNPKEEKKDWQLLDYLLTGKQYVSLLSHCQKLKIKYSQYPDSLFSISYAESIAYWELGEKEKALVLMEQIASMRPDFKSASETLAQWKEDNF